MLTYGLADYLPTGIEDAGHNGRVHVGDVALQHVGAVHHRDAGHAHVVLDGDFLARERSRRCAFDRAPPVPGVEPIVRGGWTEPRLARVLHRQCRLRELVQATVRREHTVHEVAERRQIVAAEIQVVGFGDALQFTQRWLAQNPRGRRRRGWRLHARLGGRTNGRCRRGDNGCCCAGRSGMKEATTRIVWRGSHSTSSLDQWVDFSNPPLALKRRGPSGGRWPRRSPSGGRRRCGRRAKLQHYNESLHPNGAEAQQPHEVGT